MALVEREAEEMRSVEDEGAGGAAAVVGAGDGDLVGWCD